MDGIVFVYAICNTCNIEGQFPADLICPTCGGKCDEMTLVSVEELDALRSISAMLDERGVEKTNGAAVYSVYGRVALITAELAALRQRVAELEAQVNYPNQFCAWRGCHERATEYVNLGGGCGAGCCEAHAKEARATWNIDEKTA